MKKAVVVVVTYNAMKYLPACLGSLFQTNYPRTDWEVIFVDNASEDGTTEYVRNYPASGSAITLIENQKNEGFSRGNNIGMRLALDAGADFIVLLNQDTIVEPNWLRELVAAAERDETIAAAQSLLLLYPAKEKINSWGNQIHYLGFGFCGGYKKPIQTLSATMHFREIPYASGAAMLIRASALRDVGLFDEEFFLYHEDLDLGWRLRMAGYRIVLAPYSIVYHQYEFQRSIKKYYYMERNRFLVLLEDYHWRTLFVVLPALLIFEFCLLLASFYSGWWREKLRAWQYFLSLKNWRNILKKRQEKQAKRRVSDAVIAPFLTGKIEFQEIESRGLRWLVNPVLNFYWKIAQRIIVK